MNIVKLPILLVLKMVGKCHNIISDLCSKSVISVEEINFWTPSKICAWRANTLLKKEPETIRWINEFKNNDVFWDIGANIGIYSLYASIKKEVQVYAFEPSPFNFHVLSKNIFLNNISSKLSAFCVALTNKTAVDYLNMSSVVEGAAHTSFKNTINEFGNKFTPEYSQSTIGFTIEDFVRIFNIPQPNHIKIDVDGAEKLVIDGAKSVLNNPKLKSILIEMNASLKPDEQEIFDTLVENGFYLDRSDHPDGELRLLNYIFKRR